MRNFAIRLIVNALALSAAAWLVPGVRITGDFWGLLGVAFVFGVVNAILKPILMLLSLPLLFLTLGLFSIVVNAALLMLTARIMDGFAVDGLGAALLGSLAVSFVGMILNGALKDDKKSR